MTGNFEDFENLIDAEGQFPPFGTNPKDEFQAKKTPSENIQGGKVKGALIEASGIWMPGMEPGVSRLGWRPKPIGVGIADVSSEFNIDLDFFRSTAPNNTDGRDGTTSFQSGSMSWEFGPLETGWSVSVFGHAAFGDAIPDYEQTAQIRVRSGEPGSSLRSGTDAAIDFSLGSTLAGFTSPAVAHFSNSGRGALHLEGGFTTFMFRARRITTNQSIPNNTATVLVCNTDTDDFCHDMDADYNTANGQYTVPAGGYYSVEAGVQWANSGSGVRVIQIRVNGVGVSDNRWGSIGTTVQSVSAESLHLAAGNVIDVIVQQTSGAALDAVAAQLTHFAAHRHHDDDNDA